MELASKPGIILDDIENKLAAVEAEFKKKSNSPRPRSVGGQENIVEDLTPDKEVNRDSSVWQEVATPGATPGATKNTPKRRSSAAVWKEVATPVPDELPVGTDQDSVEADVHFTIFKSY